jgi:S1-C subfamily serine protease
MAMWSAVTSVLGYSESEQGVVVTEVEPNGLAARVGIRPRNLIVAVGDTEVSDIADFREAMAKADLSKGVRLQINSDGARRFVFLKTR